MVGVRQVPSLEDLVRQRVGHAFESVVGSAVDPILRRSAVADFQANGALPLGRKLNQDATSIATKVAASLAAQEMFESVEVSGAGFINIVVSNEVLSALINDMAADPRCGVARAEQSEVVAVDYSAPNVAKEMHVGHLRSTIIGDALVRILEFAGHRVIRQNHIGDWGTPFGMLIEHLIDLGETNSKALFSIGDLNTFYKQARQKFDNDEDFADRARSRVVALQSADPETTRLWQLLVDESSRYFTAIYEQLGVRLTPADIVGESYYNDMLASLVADLEIAGLLEESSGARCVFPPGFTNRNNEPLPLIVQKADGGYGYAATDLAALRHRVSGLGATWLLYCVGSPQAQHLHMVWAVAEMAGWLSEPARAVHVANGSVLGPDGKVLRTRAGESVRLVDLLDEAVARASTILGNRAVPTRVDSDVLARQIGIGAIKYADLSTDRLRDYQFDWDRMLSFEGNTAPYLQYAHVRILSIFDKGGIDRNKLATTAPIQLDEPAERALALHILSFDSAVADTIQLLAPHRLAGYLYDLAVAFGRFYESCPVLGADATLRAGRLVVCDLAARVLQLGLDLLGIEAPSKM